MIIDFRTQDDGAIIQADLCIVGAGAAGITIARELIGSGIRVCLIESGGLNFDPDTQELYEGENRGEPRLPNLDLSRLRYFGGTTNHWGGWCTPLHDVDFRVRSWVPLSGWPISRSDLDPYYARGQSLLQLGPYIYDERVWDRIDIPPLPLDKTKVRLGFWQHRLSGPLRFGELYREDLRLANNIQVYLHANVTNIKINDSQTRVDHLDIRTLDGTAGKVRARFHVLACGGIENARILLLSNGVNPRGVGNAHDLVGRYFMEHPHAQCGEILAKDPELLFDRFLARQFENAMLRVGFRIGEQTQRTKEVLNCSATMELIPDPDSGTTAAREIWRDIKKGHASDEMPEKMWKVVRDLDHVARMIYQRLAEGRLAAPHPKLIYLKARSEQAPNPDSRITLSTKRDALGLNRVRIDWRLNAQDRQTIRVMAEVIGQEFGRLNMGRLKFADWLMDDSPVKSHGTVDVGHHMGTTRMSDNPKAGVTTPECRVHGIDNLYIAGSSIFPTSGYSHPTFTIVALAIRLADHLKIRLT